MEIRGYLKMRWNGNKMETRRLKFGANIVAFAIVVTALWVMVNYLNARHHHRFDLTENREYSLSPKTIAILKDLEEPVTITTLYRPGTFIFRQVKDILDEYAAKSSKVTVEHIDAERDRAKVELLARRLDMDTFELNTAIFQCGDRSKHVPESELLEYEQSYSYQRQPSPPKFKGEEAFTSAILECTQEEQSVLYFVSGHGEKRIDDHTSSGISNASKVLKRQNFEVKQLVLLGREQIPDDCDVLSIIGPEKKFSTQEVDLLREYLTSGGKCLVMVEPLVDCGLQYLLNEWGVELGNDIVLDPVRRLFFAGPTTIFIEDYGYHEITGGMKGVATIFSLARSVGFSDPGGQLQGAQLVKTSGDAWAETNVSAKEARYDEGEDKKGPISLAVAVSKRRSPAQYQEEQPRGTRLVVFGDSDLISNAQVGNVGNSDLFLNCINWLVEKEKLISIGPKSSDIRKVSLSAKQMRLISWSTIVVLPLLVVSMGVTIWWRRRK